MIYIITACCKHPTHFTDFFWEPWICEIKLEPAVQRLWAACGAVLQVQAR